MKFGYRLINLEVELLVGEKENERNGRGANGYSKDEQASQTGFCPYDVSIRSTPSFTT